MGWPSLWGHSATRPSGASPSGSSVRSLGSGSSSVFLKPFLWGSGIVLLSPPCTNTPVSLKAQACTPNPPMSGTSAHAAPLSASDPPYLQRECPLSQSSESASRLTFPCAGGSRFTDGKTDPGRDSPPDRSRENREAPLRFRAHLLLPDPAWAEGDEYLRAELGREQTDRLAPHLCPQPHRSPRPPALLKFCFWPSTSGLTRLFPNTLHNCSHIYLRHLLNIKRSIICNRNLGV